jgi:hypothetical protein
MQILDIHGYKKAPADFKHLQKRGLGIRKLAVGRFTENLVDLNQTCSSVFEKESRARIEKKRRNPQRDEAGEGKSHRAKSCSELTASGQKERL